jgi:recombination protein RecT
MSVPSRPATSNPPANDLRQVINSEAMRKQFALALPKALPIDRFLRCVMTQFNRDPGLLKCDRDSVLAGIMNAAQLGLEIDPVMGRAYLVPFKGKATLVVGYKGYVDLAYRSGMLAGIQAEVVYEADEFDYELGLEPKLKHRPSEAEERGALRYAYACAQLVNGGKVWRVLNRGDVMRAKKSSQSASYPSSPWQTSEAEMWRKTAVRALAKFLPLSPELRDAVAHDSDGDDERSRAAYANALMAQATPATSEPEREVEAEVRPEEAFNHEPEAAPEQPAQSALAARTRVNALAARITTAGGRPFDIMRKVCNGEPLSAATDAQLAEIETLLTAELAKLPAKGPANG